MSTKLISIFNFFLFFFSFYFLISFFFLPNICYNLKFRKKKLIFDIQKKQQINFEKNNIFFFLNNSYKVFCSNFELFIFQKLPIYKKREKIKIKKIPIFNKILNKKINFFLNQKFLFFKKIFIIN